MNATDVAAYTYAADIFCPDCMDDIARKAIERLDVAGIHDWALDTEGNLDLWGRLAHLDRYAEEMFDSGDFPKVVLADQVDADDYCGQCHAPIL